jgi:hypothetical protein
MLDFVRTSIPALTLLLTCSATAVAQQRECSAADSARVAWTAPPGMADDGWRAALLADGLVTRGTEMVRIPFDSLHSMGGDFDQVSRFNRELIREIEARIGEGPAKTLVLARIEADSTLSRLLLALPSGTVAIEQSLSEATRRARYAPAIRGGCPLAIWYPIIVEQLPTRTIGGGVGRGVAGGIAGGVPEGAPQPRQPPPSDEGTYELARARTPGDSWVAISRNDDEAVWIDAASVQRVRGDVFFFTLRRTYSTAATTPRHITYDATDDVMEFDCAAARGRTFRKRLLLGERVVDERPAEVPASNWTRSLPRRDAWCPVLRQAPSASPATPPNP